MVREGHWSPVGMLGDDHLGGTKCDRAFVGQDDLIGIRQFVGSFPGQKCLFVGLLGVSQLPSRAITQLDLELDTSGVLSGHHEAL